MPLGNREGGEDDEPQSGDLPAQRTLYSRSTRKEWKGMDVPSRGSEYLGEREK
jgi:hypothetical protein